MYAHIGIVSTAIIPANTAKGLSFAVFSVSFIAMTVLSDVLTSFGHVSLAATINSDGITDRPAIKMNSQCQLKWLMIKDPRDGAIIGPAIAADCNTVMIFLNFIPENESFIMAVVTVSIIPFPNPATPLTTMRNSTPPAKVHKKVNRTLSSAPSINTGFLQYLSLKGPPTSVPTAVVTIPTVRVRFR